MSAPVDGLRDASAAGMSLGSALDELARAETDETKGEGLADLALSLDAGPSGHGARLEARTLRFSTLEEFAAAREPSAQPLLGTPGEIVLPAGGTLLLYGDGGTSKTTLTIDAVMHLAAGVPWLGLATPRPLNVLVIENEGPRGPFRKKLGRKLASWDGPSLAGRVHALEEPWGAFTFAEENHRAELAAFLDEHEIDLVVCGPLAALGAVGGGTPEEVRAFETLLADVRARAEERAIAFWIVHHENKAGDVSGAWTRLPDSLVRAKLEGRERTILHWRKARWSGALHGATWTLAWVPERDGFELVDREDTAAKRTAELAEATDWIVRHVSEHPGLARGKVEVAYHEAHGRGRNVARRAIDEQLKRLSTWREGGEYPPRLATTTGASKRAAYLVPFAHADSPLAAPPVGESGENASEPHAQRPFADSPLPSRERRVAADRPTGSRARDLE